MKPAERLILAVYTDELENPASVEIRQRALAEVPASENQRIAQRMADLEAEHDALLKRAARRCGVSPARVLEARLG